MLSSEAAAEGMQKAVPIAKLTASPLVCTPDGARRHGGSQPRWVIARSWPPRYGSGAGVFGVPGAAGFCIRVASAHRLARLLDALNHTKACQPWSRLSVALKIYRSPFRWGRGAAAD